MVSGDHTDRNADICKTEVEKAALCHAGKSCGDFMTTGFDGAFKANTSLANLMSNLTSLKPHADATRQCMSWLTTRKPENMPLNMSMSAAFQNDEFCTCVSTAGDACDVANKRTGFMMVGSIFAVWFVVTMVLAVCRVPEKRPSRDRPPTPPIVPSMRSALNNRLFLILLPAWACDAFVTAIAQSLVPYFVEAVVAPAYQTMEENGRDCYASGPNYDGGKWIGEAGLADSPTYDRLCSTDSVIATCGLLALS